MLGLIISVLLTFNLGTFPLNPTLHNIKCAPQGPHYVKWGRSGAVFALAPGQLSKPCFTKQNLFALRSNLIGALNFNKIPYTWPSRGREVVIRFRERNLCVSFNDKDNSYILIYQPGSPLRMNKKAETVGDMMEGIKTYIRHQVTYEKNRAKIERRELANNNKINIHGQAY